MSIDDNDTTAGFLNTDKAIFAKTNAKISITNADLVANSISLTATSDLTGMTTDGFSLGPVDAKIIVALPTTEVAILGGSHLTANIGDITISAITKVGTTATDTATADASDDNSTGDVVIASTTVTGSTTLSVHDLNTLLHATGKVTLGASTSIHVTTTADGNPAAGSSKGASVGVSIVTGGGTQASVSGGAKLEGTQVDIGAASDLSVVTSASSTVGGAQDGGTPSDRLSKQALDDPKNDGSHSNKAATSGGGSVNFAGAVAVTVLDWSTSAFVNGATLNTTGGTGTIGVTATTTQAKATASSDGSNTGDSSTGVGVAVSINVVDLTTQAYLAGNRQPCLRTT